MLVVCWTPFGINFLYISQLSENLYFATRIMRNACLSKNLPLGHQKSIPKSCFFKTPSRIHFLFYFMLISYEINRFGVPFKIQWAPKWDPQSTKWRQRITKNMFCFRVTTVLFATRFSNALWVPPCAFWTDVGSHVFYSMSLSVGLVLGKRCRQSWVL